ncbi:hypothetical protein KP79_PYT20206 [Mizuhopecten yessoensis]|uniref:Uncharacterized protein n=1 Tax=Mizuhopecten yessoensis TaxID=6573 RepID=A0A210R730_MIZYE|nr:hypothetical protein KP79_PYT20206 [Mizuhopecten yessoensis]
MDIWDLLVSEEEIAVIQQDTRSVWVVRKIKVYSGMLRHWAEIHARTVQRVRCPRCSFFHIRKNQVVRHVRHEHKVEAAEAVRMVAPGERVPNNRYISTGNISIPIRSSVTPGSVIISNEDSEILAYVDDAWH